MQSGDTPPSVSMVCFYRMRGIPILLWVVGLASLFLLVGCTDGGSQAHEHGRSTHEHGGGTHEHGAAEIEYPLSQVKSDSEGQGSSTTNLHEASVDKLFSGAPKHVNVHEAGSGNPPILSCADLKRAG